MTERNVHLRVTGRVQGVGFRAFIEREAVAQGLSGWVRNRRDGSVEAVLSGDAEAVAAMIAMCRIGPRSAAVAKVTIEEHRAPVASGFAAWPTE